jgi:tetratricopeptide (TPR) repeat protein
MQAKYSDAGDFQNAGAARGVVAVAALLAATLLLSGCPASLRTAPDGGAPVTPSPGSQSAEAAAPSAPSLPPPPPPQPPPPPPRENHLSPATRSLVTQAHTLVAHGDLDGASSTLDRALRIEPNNPLLWVELGRLRLAENNAHQAEVCGRKALALASGDRNTQAQAGRLLADALRAQQRNQEAVEIERQPYMR